MRIVAAALAALLIGLAPAPAAASQEQYRRCVVRFAGHTYIGVCVLLVEDGRGSFSVAPLIGPYFAGRIHAVTVTVLAGPVAYVRGYSRRGTQPFLTASDPTATGSLWGGALRSANDPDCWIGRGFSVCAY